MEKNHFFIWPNGLKQYFIRTCSFNVMVNKFNFGSVLLFTKLQNISVAVHSAVITDNDHSCTDHAMRIV